MVWAGNFVDQGFFLTQQEVNACTWIFPQGIFPQAMAQQSMQYVAEQAPQADAIVVNGLGNFRRLDTGITERMVSLEVKLESQISKPIVASDTSLYWRVFKTLSIAPVTRPNE